VHGDEAKMLEEDRTGAHQAAQNGRKVRLTEKKSGRAEILAQRP